MDDYLQNKDYLKRAIDVLEIMSQKGAKRSAIFAAAGDYWLIIRKDFIDRRICRPIGNKGRDVAPDRQDMIEPTLAHYRYLFSEFEKAEKDRHLDSRIKKSGAWCGWLAMIISAISLSVSLCSRDREQTGTSHGSGTSSALDTRMFQDSLDNRYRSIRVSQIPHTVSDRRTTVNGDSAVSTKAR